MPKLPDTHLTYRNDETEEVVPFVLKTSVSSEGTFRINLPDEWKEVALLFKRDSKRISYGKSSQFQAEGASLREAVNLARAVMDAVYKVEVTESFHLVYRFASALSYWVNPDGKLLPNGGYPGADRAGYWRHRKGRRYEISEEAAKSGDSGVPSFGFVAFAMTRRVHTRANYQTVTWERYRRKDNRDMEEDLKGVLNSWAHGAAPEHPDSERSAFTIIPYSDKACLFFISILQSLAKIDHHLCQFFDDEAQVASAIESGRMNLFLPSNAEDTKTGLPDSRPARRG